MNASLAQLASIPFPLATKRARRASLEVSIHQTEQRIMKSALVISIVLGIVPLTPAQRPRSVSDDSNKPAVTTTSVPAPTTFKAKYEGGMFGKNHKMNGTLSFDDMNNRLVF